MCIRDRPGILAAHRSGNGYTDTSINQAPVRAFCDAAELAAMFGIPVSEDEEEFNRTLCAMQPEEVEYGTLALGYALQVRGKMCIRDSGGAGGVPGRGIRRPH